MLSCGGLFRFLVRRNAAVHSNLATWRAVMLNRCLNVESVANCVVL